MRKPVLAIAAVLVAGVLWFLFGDAMKGGLLGDRHLSGRDLLDEQGRPILLGTDEGQRDPVEAVTQPDAPGTGGVEDPTGVVVEGRVLDPGREPVAGAIVAVHLGTGEPRTTVTGADGRYAIDMGARPENWTIGVVKASAPGPRSGSTGLALHATSPDVVPLEPILLGPSHDVEVHVTHAGVPVPDARVVFAYSVFGRMTPVSEGTTDTFGRFVGTNVPEGTVRVFAAADGRGRSNVSFTLPRTSDGAVSIELTDERTLDIVAVDAATDRPVEGAVVFVGDRFGTYSGTELHLIPPVSVPPTDSAGRTTIRGLSAIDTVYVSAWKQGFARPNPYMGQGRKPAEQGVREVKVELSGYRTVRFPVGVGAAPPPREGTVLELQFQAWMQQVIAEDASARIEGGELVVTGLPQSWMMGRVVSTERTVARFTARQDADRGEAVTFEPLRDAHLRVVEADGTPVVGAPLRFQGGFTFGVNAVPTTDANGEALLTGMTATKVTVFLMEPGQTWGGQPIGQLDLSEERDLYELVVEPEAELTIHVRLDGEARLPRTYSLTIGGLPRSSSEIDEDPGAGTLALRHRFARSDKPIPVVLRAEGHLEGTGEITGGGAEQLELALEPAGTLVALLVPPEDGEYMVRIERWDSAQETWGPAQSSTPRPPMNPGAGGPSEDGTRTFDGLAAGRYRVTDGRTKISSREVEVVLGGRPSEVELDLSQAIWVTGTVVGPEGTDFGRARVYQPGDAVGRWGGTPVGADGAFRVRALRGQMLSLIVRHDVLAAAERGGSVKVVAGSGSVTLRLEVGNSIVFRLPSPEADARGFRGASVELLDPTTRESMFRATAVAGDGGFQVGGFPTGRFLVWIDAFGGAPIQLGPREMEAGVTDLGLQVPPRGSAIVVKILLKPDAVRSQAWATATWQGTPGYGRTTSIAPDGPADIVVEGLLRGRVKIAVNVLDGAGGGLLTANGGNTFDVEVDGTSDAVIELDLR